MPTYARASRDYSFIPGLGGRMEVQLYDSTPTLSENPIILDIKQWAVKHQYINKKTTHSGSNGATLRTRVGDDWTFACEVDFPANPQNLGELRFIEALLGSTYSVALRFYVGDEEFWTERDLSVLSYYASKVLIETIDTVDSSSGEEVVGLNVTGAGNSLLQAQVNGVAQWAPVWN